MRKRPKKHNEPTTTTTAIVTTIASFLTTSKDRTIRLEPLGLGLNKGIVARLIRYHMKEQDKINAGDLIASCKIENTGDIVEFRSPADGTLDKLLIEENETFDGSTDPIIILAYCGHNVVSQGLCAVCGRTITENYSLQSISNSVGEGTGSHLAHKRDFALVNVEGGLRLEVTRDEALNVRVSTVTRLFQSKRLSLVLDLDHTLLHCTDDPRAITIAQNAPNQFYTFELDNKLLVLKLRPGLRSFLRTMKDSYFEMYVYTAGTRAYAQQVCRIIDPGGTIFGGRIVSRDDTPELGTDKDLTRLFPVDDTMVVVVDDRDVWGGVANLLTCEPFDYFRGMHDVNNSGWKTISGEDGSSGSTQDDSESSTSKNSNAVAVAAETEEMDPGLARVEGILKQVHGKFFFPKEGGVTVEQQLSNMGSDVKVILRDIRLMVLKKVVIAFDPEIRPRSSFETNQTRYLEALFAKAGACGATLMDKVDTRTTHLVSCGETELAAYGKQLGIWVVRPEWLEKSEHYWQRVKEEQYSVFRTYGTRARPIKQQQQLEKPNDTIVASSSPSNTTNNSIEQSESEIIKEEAEEEEEEEEEEDLADIEQQLAASIDVREEE